MPINISHYTVYSCKDPPTSKCDKFEKWGHFALCMMCHYRQKHIATTSQLCTTPIPVLVVGWQHKSSNLSFIHALDSMMYLPIDPTYSLYMYAYQSTLCKLIHIYTWSGCGESIFFCTGTPGPRHVFPAHLMLPDVSERPRGNTDG